MKTLLALMVGAFLGYQIALVVSRPERELVRLDAVTLKKSELHHISRAIELLKNEQQPIGRAYTRYEADSGEVAFECPTPDECNLEVPARSRAEAFGSRFQLKSVTEAPVSDGSVHSEVREGKWRNPSSSEALSLKGTTGTSAEERGSATVQNAMELLGIKSGDTILSINGEKVRSPSSAFQHLQRFLDEQKTIEEVVIRRNGRRLNVSLRRD